MSRRGYGGGLGSLRQRSSVGAAAAALVVLATGCSEASSRPVESADPDRSPSTTSPGAGSPTDTSQDRLLTLEGSGSACLSLRHGPDYTHWEHVVTPPEDLTVDRIRLLGADNIAVVGRGLVAPVPDAVPVSGWSNGWPISARSAANDQLAWDEREPALGAELREGQAYNLFVHLRLGDRGDPAAYRAMELQYTAAGETHMVRDRIRVRVRERCP